MVGRTSSERTGYPTQKPLALYERIIKASSNPGDWVLDPFCGCATTPVAAERLGRQWVGIDIWDKAHGTVLHRMEDNRQLLTDIPTIHYETTTPVRTDGGLESAPFIQVTERYAEPNGPRMSRAEMYEYLLAQHGQRCQGCDRGFDDATVLGAGPQHAALRRRAEPCHQPDSALRAMQQGQEQHLHVIRIAQAQSC